MRPVSATGWWLWASPGVGYSASAGIISAKERSTGIYQAERGFESFLQTDAAINPGNSGGPMVDLRGQVIGVNANIISKTGSSIGLGFAIPAKLARRVAEDLIDDGRIDRPMIGIQMAPIEAEEADRLRVPNRRAVTVERVMPGSAAERGGLQAGRCHHRCRRPRHRRHRTAPSRHRRRPHWSGPGLHGLARRPVRGPDHRAGKLAGLHRPGPGNGRGPAGGNHRVAPLRPAHR